MLQSIFLGRNNADEPTPPETGIICDFDASAVDKCLNPFNDPCLLDDPVKTWISNNEPVNAIQPTFSKQPIFGFDGQINKNYVNFPGSEFMLIFDSKTLFNQNDMSIYIVSAILNPYSSDTLFTTCSDYYWTDGVNISTGFSGQHISTAFGETIEDDNGNGFQRQIRSVRIKRSEQPFKHDTRVNNRFVRPGTIGGQAFDTSRDALIGASWNSSGSGQTFFFDGWLYKLIIFNKYHTDAEQDAQIDQLNQIYNCY